MEITQFSADLLTNDAGAVGRSRLMDELSSMANTVRHRLDKGMTPDEAVRARAVGGAIDAARQIVDQIWDNQYN